MGLGKLNIWIRDEDCGLRNAWRVDLEVKTCTGENLIDIVPPQELDKILKSLKEMYPNETVTTTNDYGPSTIRIQSANRIINHLHIEIPPGCYVIRVHVCGGGNEWSDRTMVMVKCSEEACVNLIIPEAESCIRGVIIPVLRLAELARLPREQVKVAVDVLGELGRVQLDGVERDLNNRVRLLRDAKIEDAKEVIKASEYGLKLLKLKRPNVRRLD